MSDSIELMAWDAGITLPMQPGNATDNIIWSLILQNTLQIRTSILVTAGFNITVAVVMVLSIFYDAIMAWRRESYKLRSTNFFASIHPAETFPIIISFAVIIQGVVFLVVQSTAMQDVEVTGCRRTAEIVWPAIWNVGYTMLVFGMETMFRSLRRVRFSTRRVWETPLCIIIIIVMTAATWIPSYLDPTKDSCFATLIWWTERYATIGLAICSGLIFTYFLSGTIIFIQLRRSIDVELEERIAATRIVCYLGLSVAIMAAVLPYYLQIQLGHSAQLASRIADIALNIVGLLNGVLHIFLRTNAERFMIRPIDYPPTEKKGIRVFGPNELNMAMQISTPVILHRTDSELGMLRSHESSPYKTTISPTNAIVAPMSAVSPLSPGTRDVASQPPMVQLPPQNQRKKSTYSIFPTSASEFRHVSWNTAHSDVTESSIQPPPPLFSHRRSLSAETSQTVEIGLRISQAPDGNSPRNPSHVSIHYSPLMPDFSDSDSEHPQEASSSQVIPMRIDSLGPRKPSLNVPTSRWPIRRDSVYGTPVSRRRQSSAMKSLPPIPNLKIVIPDSPYASQPQSKPQSQPQNQPQTLRQKPQQKQPQTQAQKRNNWI